MKQFFTTLFSSFFFFCSYGQSFETKVAVRSCEYLKKEKVVVDSVLRHCISKSMLEIAREDSTRQYLKIIGTVEGIKGTHIKVRALLSDMCKDYMVKPEEN
jgi:hypothetical protein